MDCTSEGDVFSGMTSTQRIRPLAPFCASSMAPFGSVCTCGLLRNHPMCTPLAPTNNWVVKLLTSVKSWPSGRPCAEFTTTWASPVSALVA